MAKPYVFIIESPNSSDIASDRSEGASLSSALKLAGSDNVLFSPRNLHEFTSCFDSMLDQLGPYISNNDLRFPMVHFSAHGNEQGIGLTSGEFVSWATLSTSLINAAKEIQLLDPTDQMAMWLLSFSTCKGAHARQLLSTGVPSPCCGIVGPVENVTWQDGLTAYVVYFHLMLTKRIGADNAVKIMNVAAGLSNVFQQYSAPAMAEP